MSPVDVYPAMCGMSCLRSLVIVSCGRVLVFDVVCLYRWFAGFYAGSGVIGSRGDCQLRLPLSCAGAESGGVLQAVNVTTRPQCAALFSNQLIRVAAHSLSIQTIACVPRSLMLMFSIGKSIPCSKRKACKDSSVVSGLIHGVFIQAPFGSIFIAIFSFFCRGTSAGYPLPRLVRYRGAGLCAWSTSQHHTKMLGEEKCHQSNQLWWRNEHE